MSSERGGICFVCFGVLRLPSLLRAALGSKAIISLNTLCVQETPGLRTCVANLADEFRAGVADKSFLYDLIAPRYCACLK